ncbi:phytanoyl-CoA dioxygenase family protein [Shewanella sp. NIFS-20-20]|uniref:phytanoyl-CoA dioxygenase family protein n=1 Tax=Shewanella sp. NIFS-20-20 TaxID=2853806 RepID=UPI001C45ED05|nr:phytanoyl-CoA dioxygenase family protein [Shewanella sp. NIFS-20-20]MBV7317230.1 phytanoyl-CoA dioxygenase family protein [Shewanella sp. NIFS-20-20]
MSQLTKTNRVALDLSGVRTNGFQQIPAAIPMAQLKALRQVAQAFHARWQQDNQDFYQTNAINSAYLTASAYLQPQARQWLFDFIGGQLMKDVISPLFGSGCGFLNTQLFFNPLNPEQANYWHRDGQYHLDLQQQQQILSAARVLHVRVALFDEPGLEFIPASHTQWDTELQLDCRLGRNGAKPSDDLPEGQTVPLQAGDMLLFDANMIHRGIYGMDRLALDILFCDPLAELLQFARQDCLPDEDCLQQLVWPDIFRVTANILKKN